MNAISVTAEIEQGALRATQTFQAGGLAAPRLRAPAAWLPVPSLPERRASQRQPTVTSATARIKPARSSPGEKLFLGLLTAAATIAIAYGFSCLVDLVQNWASFNAGIGRLVQ